MDEVSKLLIEAMVKLHKHVIHAGTDFEDRALASFGQQVTGDISGYAIAWDKLQEEAQRVG